MALSRGQCVSDQCLSTYRATLHTVLTVCSFVTMLLMAIHLIMPQEYMLKMPSEFKFTMSSSGAQTEFGKLIPVYPDDLTLK